MYFVKLGKQDTFETCYLNMEHVARVEFSTEVTKNGTQLKASVITTKSAGADRTFFFGEDAEKIQKYIDMRLT